MLNVNDYLPGIFLDRKRCEIFNSLFTLSEYEVEDTFYCLQGCSQITYGTQSDPWLSVTMENIPNYFQQYVAIMGSTTC